MSEEISREEIAALLARGSEDTISRHDEDKIKLVSKQDVINLIDEWNAISFYEANEHSKECYYEMRNAIIAMQPVASCLDTISRQAALDAIFNNAEKPGDAYHAVRMLAPVAPKQRTGHWITVTNGRGGHECSLCHEYAPSYKNGDEWLTKYCPKCGAMMQEVEE